MKYLISTIILIFLISCKNSQKEENSELNKIVKSIVSNERKFSPSLIYITDSLKQLKVYVPSKDEIEQRIPPPPPGKTTSIIRLLDFKKNYTKNDSIKILNQNNYKLKKIEIDKTINSNLEIIDLVKNEKGSTHLSFSTPIYFENDFVYMEVGFYEYGFSRGTGYLLKKENNVWKIIGQEPLWIS